MGYLKFSDRCRIEALLKADVPKRRIALLVGCSERTIYNEIRRGKYQRLNSDFTTAFSYSAEIAQRDFERKQTAKGAPLRLGHAHDMAAYIEQHILLGWSPDAICGRLRLEDLWPDNRVCTTTLYNYVRQGVFLRVSERDLFYKGQRKRHCKRVTLPVPVYGMLNRRIDSRPDLSARQDYGHWEMDTVCGKRDGGGPVLLVLTERKTRYELVYKIDARSADAVCAVLDRLHSRLPAFGKVFKTITMDNGKEFVSQSRIEKGARTTAYYCHPYSSWERGSNENANKLVRRFFPKGHKIAGASVKAHHAAMWINNLPRRVLGYHTASEMCLQELVALGVAPGALGL